MPSAATYREPCTVLPFPSKDRDFVNGWPPQQPQKSYYQLHQSHRQLERTVEQLQGTVAQLASLIETHQRSESPNLVIGVDPVEAWIEKHTAELMNHEGKHLAINYLGRGIIASVDSWQELVELAGQGHFNADTVLVSWDELDLPAQGQ